MEEDLPHLSDDALVDADLVVTVRDDLDVVDVLKARGILSQVARLVVLVFLVVGRDNDDRLAHLGQLERELVDHDTQSAHSGPSANFRGAEYNRTEDICLED